MTKSIDKIFKLFDFIQNYVRSIHLYQFYIFASWSKCLIYQHEYVDPAFCAAPTVDLYIQCIYHDNILFHISSKFDFYIGVDMVMCHALLCIKEIHQSLT